MGKGKLMLLLFAGGISLSSADVLESGTGYSSRYWDCCKPNCAAQDVAAVSRPPMICDSNDTPFFDFSAASGCSGGNAFMCSDYTPIGVTSDLSFGFASVSIADRDASSVCCGCFRVTFTSGPVTDKSMIVQALDSAQNFGDNQFNLLIQGGGVGTSNGCETQWDAPESGWGAQFGGVSHRDDCEMLPEALRGGCYWRFDWFRNADNPEVSWSRIQCPTELTDLSGCRRDDDPVPGTPVQSTTTTTTTPTPTPTSTVVPHYGQCGGRTYSGPTECAEGTCTFVTDSFYQCLMPGEEPVTATTTTTAAAPSGTIVELWEQCGGRGWEGPTQCEEGTCVEVDEWYHQCQLPAGDGNQNSQPPEQQPTESSGDWSPPWASGRPWGRGWRNGGDRSSWTDWNGDNPPPEQAPEPETPETPESPETPSQPEEPAAPQATVAQQYEQCGGMLWEGPTRCVEGTTCTEVDEFYSQCLR